MAGCWDSARHWRCGTRSQFAQERHTMKRLSAAPEPLPVAPSQYHVRLSMHMNVLTAPGSFLQLQSSCSVLASRRRQLLCRTPARHWFRSACAACGKTARRHRSEGLTRDRPGRLRTSIACQIRVNDRFQLSAAESFNDICSL